MTAERDLIASNAQGDLASRVSHMVPLYLRVYERRCSESSQGGSSTQTLEDTAKSKQIKIPADKTCVQRRHGLAVGSAQLSPRLFRLSRTQPTPILHDALTK